ncbi:MAG TPA: hypothetical protein VFL59_08090 [Candidatus Nanopelagicales bacterium]|nr:hypothetical protein [Candidatus Nanopelagicales bacterium]
MSRRGRRRGAVPPPTGPLDPWTGLPGAEPQSDYTPMGQVRMWGRLAEGMSRVPGSRRGYRRRLADVGIWLFALPMVVFVVWFLVSSLASSGR